MSKKVMITGATGDVGKSLCGILDKLGYDVLSSSRRKPEGWRHPFIPIDIIDLDVFKNALKGVDVLIHLAGQREPDAGFEDLIGPNIRGAYNAFEAARTAGVKKVLFASSVNVSNGQDTELLSDNVISPSSLYGSSKAFGEALARYYSEYYKMACFCFRMGWTLPFSESKTLLMNPPMDSLYAKKVYLSVEDFAQIVHLAIEAPNHLNFGVFNALSDNREKLLDISKAESVLGYKPKHDAFSILES